MATEKFVNFGQALINETGGIDASQTSFDVDGSTLPGSPQFRIRVEDELMLVTGVAGATLTVTRGAEGTTAASHADNTLVEHDLTAGALDQFQADNVSSNAIASQPTIERAGQIFLPTDLGVLQYSDGTNWKNFAPMLALTTPPASGWSWLDQQTATTSQNELGERIEYVGTTGNFRCRLRSLVDGSVVTVTAGLRYNLHPFTNNGCGIFLRDSVTGKMTTLVRNTVNSNLFFERFTYTGSWSVQQTLSTNSIIGFFQSGIMFLRLDYDGSDVYAQFSSDGRNFITLFSYAKADAFTNNPDQFGFLVFNTYGSNTIADLVHYVET